MKKTGAEIAYLTPEPQGWRVRMADAEDRVCASLEAVVEVVPSSAEIHLALPANLVVIERLPLPAVDREELAGMVELQLEKMLPYPVEQAASQFEVIRQGEGESVVVSVAANCEQIDALCEPLRSAGRLPHRIGLYAADIAASCPAGETVLCIWLEQGQLTVAISENAKLGFAHSLFAGDAESLRAELPQILLGAEMEGVSTAFDRVRLERGCEGLRAAVAEFFGGAIVCEALWRQASVTAGSLAPPAWQQEVLRMAKAGRLRHWLQMAAVVYLLLVAASFLYLAWQKKRVQKLDQQIASNRPVVEFVASRQLRWRELAPAIDPASYAIEILNLVASNLPSAEVKLTAFEYSPSSFRIEGEAPAAVQAIEFCDRLDAEPGLKAFQIKSAPPTILRNGSAQFNISGKL